MMRVAVVALLAVTVPFGAVGLDATASPIESCFFLDGGERLPEGTGSTRELRAVPPAHVCSYTMPDGSTMRIEQPLSAAPWLMLAGGTIALAALALRRRRPGAAQAAMDGVFAVAVVGAAAFFASVQLALLLAVLAAVALWVRVLARAIPSRPSEDLLLAHVAFTALAVLAALLLGAAAGWAASAGAGAALAVSRLRRVRRPLVSPQ